jgi:hypothetical protein
METIDVIAELENIYKEETDPYRKAVIKSAIKKCKGHLTREQMLQIILTLGSLLISN